MSLIQTVSTALPFLQSLGIGRQNASQLSDCIGAAGQYGPTQALAMYPQCAPYASSMNVPIGTPNPRIPASGGAPVMPVAPPVLMAPQTPQAMPGGVPLTNPALLPVAYQPTAMALAPLVQALPKVAPMIGGAVAGVSAAVKAALPLLNRAIATASGYIVAGGLVYTAAGQLVGKVRRRRRMNPLNYRAAKRAARRLCAVKDLCGAIEKAIPARPARRRRSYAFQRKRKTCR